MNHNNNNKLTKFLNLNIYIYRERYIKRERENIIFATVSFSVLYLSLRTLFRDVSCLLGLLSNTCFLRRNICFVRWYPVLPGILHEVPRVVRGGGPCVAMMRIQPCTWCYQGVQFNLLSWSLIPGPRPAPVPAGDWGADLCGSSVSRTSQHWLRCARLPTPYLQKGYFSFPCHGSTKLRDHY